MNRLFVTAVVCLLPGAAAAQEKAAGLERCEKVVGTIAINEPQAQAISSMNTYGLKSPTDLLRSMVQESNCFTVVERGSAMTAMRQERQMASSGDFQKGSNVGKGQLQAADFILSPNIVFSQQDSGSQARQSIRGSVIGGLKQAAGIKPQELKFHEALTNMTVSDVRSGVQVATAEGRATSADLKNSSYGFQSSTYTSTGEGKVVAESLLRSYNAMVGKLKARGLSNVATTGAIPSGFEEGAMVAPKMNGLPLLDGAQESAKTLLALNATDNLLSLGEMSNGFLKVQRGASTGWVRQSFLRISDAKVATSAATSAPRASALEVGTIVTPKIDNVKLLSAPRDAATAVATIRKSQELVFLGEETNGFIKVQGSTAEGWIKSVLISPK